MVQHLKQSQPNPCDRPPVPPCTAVFHNLSLSIGCVTYFDCSSLLIVYEGANPAIRRRLVSRHNSMNTNEASASEDTERIDDDEEDIQGRKNNGTSWIRNQFNK